MPPFLDQDAGHIGGDAKTDVDRVALSELLCNAPCDHFGGVELWRFERRQGPEDLAGDCGLVDGVRRLQLVRSDDDVVDHYARNHDIVRAKSIGCSETLDLRNDNSAVVPDGQRLINWTENPTLVLV